MTKSTITREESIQAVFDLKVGYTLGLADIEILKRVARIALAAMDSEPDCKERKLFCSTDTTRMRKTISVSAGTDVAPLYRHAQPAKTVQPVMFIDGDISSEDADKLAKVIRELHEKDERPLAKMAWIIRENPHPTNECDMPKAQPAPAVQCPFPCGWDNLNKLAIQDAAFVTLALVAGEPATESIRQAAISNNDRLLKVISACRAAMLAAAPHDIPALNSVQSVVTVPGKWIPVSGRMPDDRTQVILWDAEIGEVTSGHYSHKTQTFYHCGDAIENEITHWMLTPAAPQEEKP